MRRHHTMYRHFTELLSCLIYQSWGCQNSSIVKWEEVQKRVCFFGLWVKPSISWPKKPKYHRFFFSFLYRLFLPLCNSTTHSSTVVVVSTAKFWSHHLYDQDHHCSLLCHYVSAAVAAGYYRNSTADRVGDQSVVASRSLNTNCDPTKKLAYLSKLKQWIKKFHLLRKLLAASIWLYGYVCVQIFVYEARLLSVQRLPASRGRPAEGKLTSERVGSQLQYAGPRVSCHRASMACGGGNSAAAVVTSAKFLCLLGRHSLRWPQLQSSWKRFDLHSSQNLALRNSAGKGTYGAWRFFCGFRSLYPSIPSYIHARRQRSIDVTQTPVASVVSAAYRYASIRQRGVEENYGQMGLWANAGNNRTGRTTRTTTTRTRSPVTSSCRMGGNSKSILWWAGCSQAGRLTGIMANVWGIRIASIDGTRSDAVGILSYWLPSGDQTPADSKAIKYHNRM